MFNMNGGRDYVFRFAHAHSLFLEFPVFANTTHPDWFTQKFPNMLDRLNTESQQESLQLDIETYEKPVAENLVDSITVHQYVIFVISL